MNAPKTGKNKTPKYSKFSQNGAGKEKVAATQSKKDEEKEKSRRTKGQLKDAKNDVGAQLVLQCQELYKSRTYKPEFTPSGFFRYTDPTEFRLQPWDPNDLPDDKCISMIWVGKRRTGKSFGERCYLWERRKDINEVYVFTKTKHNGWYQKFLPNEFIYDHWDHMVCRKVINRGIALKEHGIDPRIVVLGDDLISDKTVRHADEIDELFTAGRHAGVEVHFITQKYKATPPQTRINADVLVIFTMFNAKEKLAVAEECMSHMNKQTAYELIDMYTDPNLHTALVIETWRNSTNPEEYLKVWQAYDPKVKPEQIGSKEYWQAGNRGKKKVKTLESDFLTPHIPGIPGTSLTGDMDVSKVAAEGMQQMFGKRLGKPPISRAGYVGMRAESSRYRQTPIWKPVEQIMRPGDTAGQTGALWDVFHNSRS